MANKINIMARWGYKYLATFSTKRRAIRAMRKSGRANGATGFLGGHFAYWRTPTGRVTLWENVTDKGK